MSICETSGLRIMKWGKMATIFSIWIALVFLMAQPVIAGSVRGTLSVSNLDYSFTYNADNIDFATSGIPVDVYFTFTLKELGHVEEVYWLSFAAFVVTETIYVAHITVDHPWSMPGDTLRLHVAFNVTDDDILNAGWDIYESKIYFQINQSVLTDEGYQPILHSPWLGPQHVSFSTFDFIVLWPWPPIILMTFIYWFGFWALSEFNKRYDIPKFLDKARREQRNREILRNTVSSNHERQELENTEGS